MLKMVNGLSFWRVFLILIVLAGASAHVLDRLHGYTPQVHEQFPWDISATLNIFCGLSLAAGGMTIAAVLAVLELSEYRLLRRGSLLIAYLGFCSAVFTTILSYRLHWPTIWSLWSPHSIPVGAGAALILYSVIVIDDLLAATSLARWGKSQSYPSRFVVMLLTCLAAFVAGLQQTAFLNVMTLAPKQFSPMWVTSMLPVNVFLSGVSACLALIVLAYWVLGRALGDNCLAEPFDASVAALRVLLVMTIGVRMLELTDVHQWHNLAHNHLHDYLLGLELVLFLVPALFLLNLRKSEHRAAYECSIMVIAGFLVNRLNTAITSREVVIGVGFRPRISDMLFAVAVAAVGIAIFSSVMKRDRGLAAAVGFAPEPQLPKPTFIAGVGVL